jgi:antirestriction protein ArdC
MSEIGKQERSASRPALYQDITDKSCARSRRIPWVQLWAQDQTLSIPRNAATNRPYSGVNVLLLWDALFSCGFAV